jgi:ubiquinol-cytochrome c reductase cytochrome b subunit
MSAPPSDFAASAEKGTWTGRIRESTLEAFPPERLLPDRQPAYVASWAYVFGALSIGAFAIVLLSGGVLAVEGPAWWHSSSVGLFVNSTHLWSTEFFFMFMVVHLWAKFFMAAWRGRRKATWITGVLAFVISIATAFTGYLSQQNFDSEWISTQANDGINSTGAGAFWNVLNFGQMLMWHIVLLPLVVAAIIGLHVLLVRRRGVVPPFAPTQAQLAKAGLVPAMAATAPPASVLPQETFLQEPFVGQPLSAEPTGQPPLLKEPLLQEPAAQGPLTQDPTAQPPLLAEPAVAQSSFPETVSSEPLLSEPLLDESPAAEPKSEEATAADQLWQLPEDES